MTQRNAIRFRTSCLVLALWASTVAAQEKDPRVNPPVMPTGAESSSKAPGETAGAVPATPTVTPDQQPLSGGNWLGLGFWDGGRRDLISRLGIHYFYALQRTVRHYLQIKLSRQPIAVFLRAIRHF